MRQPRLLSLPGALALAICGSLPFLAASCTTVDQRLRIETEGLGMPVSLSASILLPGESLARGPKELESLGRVEESVRLRGKLGQEEMVLDLDPLLARAAGRGEGIVNLRVELESFRLPLAAPIVILRSGGSAFTAAGAAVLLSGLFAPEFPPYPSPTLDSGLTYLVPGLVALASSWGLQAVARTDWRIRFSGELVRRR
jgi:hypothetical protein